LFVVLYLLDAQVNLTYALGIVAEILFVSNEQKDWSG